MMRRRAAMLAGAVVLALPMTQVPAQAGSPGKDTRGSTTSTGISRVEIVSVAPAFENRQFGTVGSYEKVRGRVHGELDPKDPQNKIIADIDRAPRNARGNVEYSTDLYILRPSDPRKGNHKLFMEVNNRGYKLFGAFNQSPITNDPASAADAGQAFLFQQGYTVAWSGWDPQAAAANNGLTIDLPIARQRDGSSITGRSYEYIVFDNAVTTSSTLAHPTASTDRDRASLTVRDRLTDRPRAIPSSGWEYASDRSIRLLPAGTPFKQSAIYEFTYIAKDPVVAGIGFAATRDVVSFLRSGRPDPAGGPNPVTDRITRTVGYGISLPARYLNDFIWLGFNEDLRGRKVFDGVQTWLGGGSGVALNQRFAQPQRTERNRQHHLYPESVFPFSYNTLKDPRTGRVDGRNKRCSRTGTCPKIVAIDSANEYWNKAASLMDTDLSGRDLPQPSNVRHYLAAGTEHSIVGSPATADICAQPRNTMNASPLQRALFVALDEWLDGRQPPASTVPRRRDGSAVAVRTTADSALGIGVVPQQALRWPSLPGVTYTGVATVRNAYDFGPFFDRGIISYAPPRFTGHIYPSSVSAVDADGNEVAGVRLPDVAAPVATYTGWALRGAAFGGPDGCEAYGQQIALAATPTDRVASGDPRPSLAERYRTHQGYVDAVASAAARLQDRRLLLPADARAYRESAEASGVLR